MLEDKIFHDDLVYNYSNNPVMVLLLSPEGEVEGSGVGF